MDSLFYLAWKYVSFNRFKSIVLVLCLAFSIYLPVTGKAVLDNLEVELRNRAIETPYVLGAKGSQFDLTLHTLYLDVDPPETIVYTSFRFARDTKPGNLVPIYRTHVVQENKPVVGTDLSYFDFRGLELEQGFLFQRIGHCVIGANVAQELNVGLDDSLISKPENDVNLAGATPVKMDIVGILKRSGTADDDAVFTDIKTTWVIDGLGHGHDDLEQEENPDLFIDRDEHMAIANKGVLPYIEITDENVSTVHFHGDPDEFPLTAIILFPKDEKSATLLQGKIEGEPERQLQMVTPSQVIEQLVDRILKVKSLFDIASVVILIITLLFLILNTALSVRLRQREMVTMYKMGCGRYAIFGLYSCEYLILLGGSLLLALGAAWSTMPVLQEWIRQTIR